MEQHAEALLEAFLNSHDNGERREWFDPAVPEAFDDWVRGSAPQDGAYYAGEEAAAEAARRIRALMGDTHAGSEDVALARDVRDGLLAMIERGEGPDGLDALLGRLPVRLAVGDRIEVRAQGGGPLAIVAEAVAAAMELQVTGAWARLRLCRGETCHWAFLDRSKNRSRVWCDMTSCGAKAKARAYRKRQRSA